MSPVSRLHHWIRRGLVVLCAMTAAAGVVPHRAVADDVVATSACGDGLLEADETCQACPADCRALSCKPSGRQRIAVTLETAPGFEIISTLTARIGFRSNLLALPGSGSEPAVRARTHVLQPGTTVTVNDLGAAVRVLASRRDGLPAGRVLELEFDTCAGAPRAAASDLSCAVEACAWGGSPVTGCRCTVDAL